MSTRRTVTRRTEERRSGVYQDSDQEDRASCQQEGHDPGFVVGDGAHLEEEEGQGTVVVGRGRLHGVYFRVVQASFWVVHGGTVVVWSVANVTEMAQKDQT